MSTASLQNEHVSPSSHQFLFGIFISANFNNEQGEIESFSKELTRNVFNQKQGYMLLF